MKRFSQEPETMYTTSPWVRDAAFSLMIISTCSTTGGGGGAAVEVAAVEGWVAVVAGVEE